MPPRRLTFNHENPNKVILLGNAGVGKTSLANRWIHGEFDSDVASTVGASNGFKEVFIGQTAVRITLWDTAGQEQYRSITPLYVRGASVGIIVAAADDSDSVESVPTWVNLLNSAQESSIPALLAINKSDLRDPWADEAFSSAIERHRHRFVTTFVVSARNGEQVSELFEEAARLANQGRTVAADLIPSIVPTERQRDSDCC
jgi:small GTP-binding protein